MSCDSSPEVIQSPCIGVCTMNETTGLCAGCYRTLDEIRAWWDMAQEKRDVVMAALPQRQLEYVNFD